MTHLRQPFPAHLGALTARSVAEKLRAAGIASTCAGEGLDTTLTHLDRLEGAAPGGLVFVRTAQHAREALERKPGALLGSEDALREARGCALVVVPDADRAVLALLHLMMPPPAQEPSGAHESCVIHPGAVVESSASVGPLCVVERGARINQGARLLGHVYVGAGASIGAGSLLHPGVRVLDNCTVGRNCILHAGVVIGADGFGYTPRDDGRGLAKIPHVGTVVIEDDVEIGANSCIDRAKFGATRVGRGTKIDNLVQVGHNCDIGRSCVLCGEVGLAGSVTLGDGVVLGGRAGVADNVVIGAGARIAAYSAVSNDVPAGATYMGIPARPADEARRTFAALRKLGKRSE